MICKYHTHGKKNVNIIQMEKKNVNIILMEKKNVNIILMEKKKCKYHTHDMQDKYHTQL